MGLSNTFVPPIDPVATVKLTPEFGEKSIREKVIWGPFKAQPANVRTSRQLVKTIANERRELMPEDRTSSLIQTATLYQLVSTVSARTVSC
jgi:hypothetical protein